MFGGAPTQGNGSSKAVAASKSLPAQAGPKPLPLEREENFMDSVGKLLSAASHPAKRDRAQPPATGSLLRRDSTKLPPMSPPGQQGILARDALVPSHAVAQSRWGSRGPFHVDIGTRLSSLIMGSPTPATTHPSLAPPPAEQSTAAPPCAVEPPPWDIGSAVDSLGSCSGRLLARIRGDPTQGHCSAVNHAEQPNRALLSTDMPQGKSPLGGGSRSEASKEQPQNGLQLFLASLAPRQQGEPAGKEWDSPGVWSSTHCADGAAPVSYPAAPPRSKFAGRPGRLLARLGGDPSQGLGGGSGESSEKLRENAPATPILAPGNQTSAGTLGSGQLAESRPGEGTSREGAPGAGGGSALAAKVSEIARSVPGMAAQPPLAEASAAAPPLALKELSSPAPGTAKPGAQTPKLNEQIMTGVARLGESVSKAVAERREQRQQQSGAPVSPRTPSTGDTGAGTETPRSSGPVTPSTGSGLRSFLGTPRAPEKLLESPDTPKGSLESPTKALRVKIPKPKGEATPSDVQAVTAGVLKSLDTIYSAGVARPVGSLLGPSVEKLQQTLQQVSLKELLEGLQRIAKARKEGQGARPVYPNKAKLSSVQDFFLYAETEGRKLFEELDFDGDGQVTLQDLEHTMRKRRLPKQYAREMLRRARGHWLATSFGWAEFQALMEQKEPSMLRAFTSLNISASGTLQREQVLASLKKAGLPATEENARAMMRFLDADGEKGQVTYGQFRNFLLLLPPERLSTADPSMVWFEAATVVPMGPPVARDAGASVLRSALAGGLASGLSTCVMHPLDTIKTRVQASSATLDEVIQSVPQLGLAGLYRGATPAILGQFASHGLRTGVFEATRMLLQKLKPDLAEVQVQPVASFCSTVLGTAIRIPCEVLKQRLQAGMYPSVGAALSGTLKDDGVRGLFKGTTATLFREVPFYVFGMLIYLQVKKAVKGVLRRDLAPWETLLLGGVSGGLAAVAITPFDVIKTRMMVAPKGSPSGLIGMGVDIVSKEGVSALYKGALPRFFWIAPLGAMNFAGYELAKQAMEEGGDS